MLTTLSEELQKQAQQHGMALAELQQRAEGLEHSNKALSCTLERNVTSIGKRLDDVQGNNVEALNTQVHHHSRRLDEAAGALVHLKDQVR